MEQKGIHISGVYYCPHHPNAKIKKYKSECECRESQISLFLKAQRELGIDMEHSIAVGDKERDLCICDETNVRGCLLDKRTLLDIAHEAADYSD